MVTPIPDGSGRIEARQPLPPQPTQEKTSISPEIKAKMTMVEGVKDLQASEVTQITEAQEIQSLEDMVENLRMQFAAINKELGLNSGADQLLGNQIIGGLIDAFQVGQGLNETGEEITEKVTGFLESTNLAHLSREEIQRLQTHRHVTSLLSNVSKLLGMLNQFSLLLQNREIVKDRLELLSLIKALAKKKEKLQISTNPSEIKLLKDEIRAIELKISLREKKDRLKNLNNEADDGIKNIRIEVLKNEIEKTEQEIRLSGKKENLEKLRNEPISDVKTLEKEIEEIKLNIKNLSDKNSKIITDEKEKLIEKSKYTMTKIAFLKKEEFILTNNYILEEEKKLLNSLNENENPEIKMLNDLLTVLEEIQIKNGSLEKEKTIPKQEVRQEEIQQLNNRSNRGIKKLHNEIKKNEEFITSLKKELIEINKIYKFNKNEEPKNSDDLIHEIATLEYEITNINEKMDKLDNFNKAQEEPEILKYSLKEIPELEKELRAIAQNIKELKYGINENGKDLAKSLNGFLPKLANNIYSNIKFFRHLADNPLISESIGGAFTLASIIHAGYDLSQAYDASDSQKRHVADLAPLTLKGEINPADIDRKIKNANKLPRFKDISDDELTDNQRVIKTILTKREAVFNQQLEREIEQETKWFEELLAKYENNFEGFKKMLENSGVVLDETITSFDKIDSKLKLKLLKMHIERRSTLLITAKNQLKARLEAVEKINQGFFSFKLTKSQVMFGVTVITAIGSILITAATIAGVALPPVLLAIPGAIMTVATFGFIGLGLYYLHQHKPNLAKTYFTLTPARIMLNNIALGFAEFNLDRAKNKKADLVERVSEKFFSKTLPEEGADEAIMEEQSEVNESLRYWQELCDEYQGNINYLEQQVHEARIKDYEKQTGYHSFGDIAQIDVMRTREIELQNKPELTAGEQMELKFLPKNIEAYKKRIVNEFDIIAESLIKGEFWNDPEASAFLRKYAGIEIEKEAKLDSSKLEENTKYLSKKLQDIVLRNSKEILEWLEKQKINEVKL